MTTGSGRLILLAPVCAAALLGQSRTVQQRFELALVASDIKMVESLLSAGVNPDLRDRFGRTPLHTAVTFSDEKVVRVLLEHHADPNAVVQRQSVSEEFASTPLQAAAQLGNVRMAKMLIKAGAQVNTTVGRSALARAVFFNRLDMMDYLLDAGADVNVRDPEGASPLDDAVWRGSFNAVAILLAHGARLNDPDTRTGATPVNEAAYRGHTGIVRYLLQFHPDLTIADKRGYGPLENAVRMGKEETALLLLDPGTKLSDGALDAAIKKDEAGVVGVLLRGGMPPDAALASGLTPLDLAASTGSEKVARVLLEGGADANTASRNGATPLEDAALKGFGSLASILLDHGARTDVVNADSGTTALYAAAAFGKSETVKLLLDRGANPSLCGNNRKSPYQAAMENGYREVAEQIQQKSGTTTCRGR